MKKKLLLFSLLSLLCGMIYMSYDLHFIPHRQYDNKDFDIKTYVSQFDQDNDGIDDQSDILQNVRAYIETQPKYKSQYYGSGYPDDGYGVCSDVVGFGLLNAGYDLKELVNEDILLHRDDYQIDVVDKNIDFRRVRNLKIYFDHQAISLTQDIHQIEKWQGGDIVVFQKHIGIVSDQRNKNGVPLIIHHYSPYQISYEEDILEKRNDIIGHYRIS